MDGKLVINEKEAEIVRRIYREFLWGSNPRQIARGLEEDGVEGCLGSKKWYPSTVENILKNEKHKGDALLQKSYTADFLTRKQVKNQGEVAQVYVKGSHEGIIDKETWEAVQLEFERRERFKAEHGLKTYGYGSGCNPFSGRIFCGNCGNPYTKHSWKSRGVEQWQCRNHITDGKVTCINGFVKNEDLESGFVKAYNMLMADRERNFPEWERMQAEGNPLERLRAGQFLELAGEPPLTVFVPELAELVIQEVSILNEKEYEFVFIEGSRKVAKI